MMMNGSTTRLSSSVPTTKRRLWTKPRKHSSSISIPGHHHGSSKSISQHNHHSHHHHDQVVPLDFSIRGPRKSNKRPSVIAFGMNEIDTQGSSSHDEIERNIIYNTTAYPTTNSSSPSSTTSKRSKLELQPQQQQLSQILPTQFQLQQLEAYFNTDPPEPYPQQQQEQEEQLEPINYNKKQQPRVRRQPSSSSRRRNYCYAEYNSALQNTFIISTTSKGASGTPNGRNTSHNNNNNKNNGNSNGNGKNIGSERGASSRNEYKSSGGCTNHDSAHICGCDGSGGGRGGSTSTQPPPRQQLYINYQLFIDEHFRRSLGLKKYRELFPSATTNSTSDQESSYNDAEEEKDHDDDMGSKKHGKIDVDSSTTTPEVIDLEEKDKN